MVGSKELFIEMQDRIMATIHDYDRGDMMALETFIALREYRNACEDSLAMIKEFEKENFEQIAEQSKDYGGEYAWWSIEVRQGRKIFDYSNIEEIKIAEANVKELKEYYKQAFQSHQKDILIADSDGVEIELPTLKYASPSIVAKKQ